jgi:hypothetical protein
MIADRTKAEEYFHHPESPCRADRGKDETIKARNGRIGQ